MPPSKASWRALNLIGDIAAWCPAHRQRARAQAAQAPLRVSSFVPHAMKLTRHPPQLSRHFQQPLAGGAIRIHRADRCGRGPRPGCYQKNSRSFVFLGAGFRGAAAFFLTAFRGAGLRRATPSARSSTSSRSFFSAGVTSFVNLSGRSATNCCRRENHWSGSAAGCSPISPNSFNVASRALDEPFRLDQAKEGKRKDCHPVGIRCSLFTPGAISSAFALPGTKRKARHLSQVELPIHWLYVSAAALILAKQEKIFFFRNSVPQLLLISAGFGVH